MVINTNSLDFLIGKAVGIESAVREVEAESQAAFTAGDDHKANLLRRVAKNLRVRAAQAREAAAKMDT